uniref:F-box domain-containing protein n=2 Tax=Setaria italica TaxID=4555 RepID=K3Z0G0_SETIT
MGPPPSPASMVNLPDDLLLSILSRIPCKADRARMSVVCKAWRAVLARLKAPRPRPLPWFLLPTPHLGGPTNVACALSGFRVHHYISINPPGARFFGSHDGAGLFLHYSKKRSHLLLDARNSRVRDLPAEILRWNDPNVHRMVILAATLSSSPDDPNCVAAAIVAASRDPDPAPGAVAPLPPIQRCAAFWRMGWPRAIEGSLNADQSVPNPEDIVYHDGAFRFLLTHGDHILVCTPTMGQAGNLMTDWELQSFRPGGRIYDDQFIRARYLVESRGGLLLVLRFTAYPTQPWTTSLFKVFLATRRKIPNADADFPVANYPWSWIELDTLGGRMLFVGYGCSRSYEVDQYPGFKDGIYFLDDGKLEDNAMIFGEDNMRQYPCSDNGKWSEGHVQRCFPRPDPSDYSAPVWLLP